MLFHNSSNKSFMKTSNRIKLSMEDLKYIYIHMYKLLVPSALASSWF